MKMHIMLAILILPFACGGGSMEIDDDIGTTSEQKPTGPSPAGSQRNDKNSKEPMCECDGTGCFCLAPGAVIVYWKGTESGLID